MTPAGVRLARWFLSAEVLGLLLVSAALYALTDGIASSLRNTDTRLSASFFWICLLAALIAYEFSKRLRNGILGSLWMIVLGILGIWILAAQLASPLRELAGALLAVAPRITLAIRENMPIDVSAITEAWLVVTAASDVLRLRFQLWLMSLNGEVAINDALIRNMIWLLIVWLLSAWMGWFTGRRNALAALLPSILLLAAITSYSGFRVYTLWVMVVVLLLLMGVWNYRNHTSQWERQKVDYSDSIRYDVTQAVVFLSLAIGALAFITPSISWRQIRDLFRERGDNEIAETLGVQRQPVAAQGVPVQKPSLPRDHLLSGGFAQSEEIVMIIRTGELPPVVIPEVTTNAPRHYWRSTTYDVYVGAGWVTSSAPGQRYGPNTPLIPGVLNGYKPLHLDVEMVQPEGKLFWSGILFSADVPIRADWRLRPESNLFADQSSLLQADLFAAASAATVYQAESYVPLVTVEELRNASTDYPESIQERYLNLPRSLPERVRQLAGELTEDKLTAYDKAKAIEAYLRSYPYDLEVPVPPEDQDVADYFLFDLKKGYCDYYATAMVVLARASGLPARFVSGYASGSYDAASAEYVVRQMHAHSWAEIYFPEIGWVEFEPTAAQPEIEIPPSRPEITDTAQDETANRLLNRFRLETLVYWSSPFMILFFALVLYFVWIEPWRYMHMAPAIAVEKMYRQLYRIARPLAGERAKAETTYEFMQKLIRQLNRIGEHSRFTNYLARAVREVESLTDLYQESMFAQHTAGKHDVRTALNIWKPLRGRLLLARLNMSFHAVTRPRAKHLNNDIRDSSVTEERSLRVT
jgi:hypothetical protein